MTPIDILRKLKTSRWIVVVQVICLLAALALGGLAQSRLAQGKDPNQALALYGAAAVLFVFPVLADRPGGTIRRETQKVEQQPARPEPLPRQRVVIGLAYLALSALATVGSLAHFSRTQEPPLSAWLLYVIGLLTFLTAIAIWEVRCSRDTLRRTWARLVQARWELLALLLILVVGGFLRYYHLGTLPQGVWYDEADNGLRAQRILEQPGFYPLFDDFTNMATHYHYLLAFSFKLFGVHILSIRLVTATMGLLTVWPCTSWLVSCVLDRASPC